MNMTLLIPINGNRFNKNPDNKNVETAFLSFLEVR